jgi:tryptophan halogenase
MPSENIQRIVIVGGGTSGWMTAATFIKFFPQKHITVIESEDVPTIGVGESTTGILRNWLKAMDIKDEDFMKECDAIYKLSIKFTDFASKDSDGFHYPLGTAFTENTGWGLWDWHLMKYKYPETDNQDFVRSYFPAASLFEQNKISENKDGKFDNFDLNLDSAYHIDAIKFGKWMREKYCKPKGVRHIVATVNKINTNEDGIKDLELSNGNTIDADLFIDCTGFKSLLLGGAMEEPFESLDHIMFNDKAWVTPLEYKDKDIEMRPYTECFGLSSGWSWFTPIYSRVGTGYVYSNKFISDEDALEEFKQFLMSDKLPIPRTREEVDSFKYRQVPMRTGKYSRLWVKNVLAIGLSGGFIEPLEGNAIYSVHEFLVRLLRILELPKVNQFDKDMFNSTARFLFKNFSEFVGLHYSLSHRDDTPYWKAVTNNTYSQTMIDYSPDRTHGYNTFQDIYMHGLEYTSLNAGINYVSTGMGYLLVDRYIMKMKEMYNPSQQYDIIAKAFKDNFEDKKTKWLKAAEKEKTIYQYLKEKYNG